METIEKYFTLTGLLGVKSRKVKAIEYIISGILLCYAGLLCCPNLLFGHSIKYKNFNIYSTSEFDNSICNVLDKTRGNLSASSINDTTITHNIYLCNSYSLYSFFAPFVRKSFACNYCPIKSIFISNCDVRMNEAYKNDENDSYTRQLSELIAHEVTHTLTERKLGFWKYRTLERWKNEGYSETIGHNEAINLPRAKEFLRTNENNNRPGILYQKYYFAVAYLMQIEKMKFEDIVAAKYTLDNVLNKIETIKIEN